MATPLARSSMLVNRLNVMAMCLAGCVVAGLFGLWAILKFDAPIVALFAVAVFPVFGCWIAGLHDRKQLAKIAVYAAMGWTVCFVLGKPAVAQSSHSHSRRIIDRSVSDARSQAIASAASTILALVGVGFLPHRKENA